MTSMHEPAPDFERYLEWQVTTALRRQDRFARPSAIGSSTYLRALPIVFVSVLLGAGGVTAAGRLQQNQEKQLLTVQQQGELQLAEVQLLIAQKNLQDTKRRVEIGVAPLDEAATGERALRTAMLRLQQVKLSLEEVQLSGRAVQDDVTAPVVNARDFVLERLQIDQQMAAAAAVEAEKHLQTMQKRYEVGLTPQVDLLEAQSELVSHTSDMKAIEDKIALRQKFIAGNVSAADATKQRLLIAAQNELRSAQAALDVATKRYAQIEKQMQVGAASDVDALKARLDMLSRQQDIERLRERLAALAKGGALPGGR
jgi:hypothetical protein